MLQGEMPVQVCSPHLQHRSWVARLDIRKQVTLGTSHAYCVVCIAKSADGSRNHRHEKVSDRPCLGVASPSGWGRAEGCAVNALCIMTGSSARGGEPESPLIRGVYCSGSDPTSSSSTAPATALYSNPLSIVGDTAHTAMFW